MSNWDTSRVTSLRRTFFWCDLVHGRWSVKLGYVECDDLLFKETFSGSTSFTGEGLSDWNTSGVTDLSSTFSGAIEFNADISSWDVSRLVAFRDTFSDSLSLFFCTERSIYNSWDSQQSGLMDTDYEPIMGFVRLCLLSDRVRLEP